MYVAGGVIPHEIGQAIFFLRSLLHHPATLQITGFLCITWNIMLLAQAEYDNEHSSVVLFTREWFRRDATYIHHCELPNNMSL